MNIDNIRNEIAQIRKTLDDLHASKPLTPDERARLLQVLVYLRFHREVIELSSVGGLSEAETEATP
jgi:hypothetical protein